MRSHLDGCHNCGRTRVTLELVELDDFGVVKMCWHCARRVLDRQAREAQQELFKPPRRS